MTVGCQHLETVERVNPWWYAKSWEEEDRTLLSWQRQKVKWEPGWIESLPLDPFSLNFVYGPRQAGKTTGMKLLIRRLTSQGFDPRAIYYIDLDAMASLKEFRGLMERLMREKERRGTKTSLFFFDEVTSVDDWWKVIKFLIDSGELAHDVVTLTGSSTIGLIKAPERFPGRTGKGKTLEVLPLSFTELLNALGHEAQNGLYRPAALRETWEKYKAHGGFPKAVNQQQDASEALISGLLSETYKHRRSPRIVQEVFSSLLSKVPSALSYNSIASDLGVSHVTVREYLEFLSDLLLIGMAPLRRDGTVVFRKEKKVFVRDPFALRTFSSWAGASFLESALVEGIVQEHLYRRFGEVYYYRNHYEIDAVAGGLRVEVKTGKPHRSYPKGVEVLDDDGIPEFLVELSAERGHFGPVRA